MNITLLKRLITAYTTVGKNFGFWISPIFSGILLLLLRLINFIFMKLDWIFFKKIRDNNINNPIIIVGNPRSGTTFLHRYLVNSKIGIGTQLWQMLYT
ncbi:uncharacterized protein METZ01_LOCUS451639, partial [marine metagenome]